MYRVLTRDPRTQRIEACEVDNVSGFFEAGEQAKKAFPNRKIVSIVCVLKPRRREPAGWRLTTW